MWDRAMCWLQEISLKQTNKKKWKTQNSLKLKFMRNIPYKYLPKNSDANGFIYYKTNFKTINIIDLLRK